MLAEATDRVEETTRRLDEADAKAASLTVRAKPLAVAAILHLLPFIGVLHRFLGLPTFLHSAAGGRSASRSPVPG